uniref:JmjC domain-containing protein n=1 Tax=Macrostomum lignano TaxID=282301 RepID=A0A1I8H2S7_9PLAT
MAATENQPADANTNGNCDSGQKHIAIEQPAPSEMKLEPDSKQQLEQESPAKPQAETSPSGKQLKRELDANRQPEESLAKKKKKHNRHHPDSEESQPAPATAPPSAIPSAAADDATKNGHSPDQHMMQLTAQPRRKLIDLMYIEKHSNGGGLALHAYAGELARLDRAQLAKFATLFLRNLLVKERGKPGRMHSNYCVGVVHGAAHDLPDLLSELCRKRPNLAVKSRHLEKKNEVESLTAADYLERIRANYAHGTFRSGSMESVSMVGAKGEETGCLMNDMLATLESNPFLAPVMPWGPMSHLAGSKPSSSNDGPILWTRPGEQALCSGSERGSGSGRDSLSQMYSTGSRGRRQVVITDRTHAHADHADDGLDRHTTAAVGMLQCVHAEENRRPGLGEPGRVCKDAILFDPRHYTDLIIRLQLDILEPPMTQCSPQLWLDDAELNLLRREGFRYSRQHLRDNDIYYIPRGVVHQFRTVSAVTSVAWHVRMAAYYPAEQQQQPATGSAAEPAADADDKSSAKEKN